MRTVVTGCRCQIQSYNIDTQVLKPYWHWLNVKCVFSEPEAVATRDIDLCRRNFEAKMKP